MTQDVSLPVATFVIDPTHPQLLTAIEVANRLRIGVKKVYSLPIPQVRLSDRRVRYLISDVDAFVLRSRRGR